MRDSCCHTSVPIGESTNGKPTGSASSAPQAHPSRAELPHEAAPEGKKFTDPAAEGGHVAEIEPPGKIHTIEVEVEVAPREGEREEEGGEEEQGAGQGEEKGEGASAKGAGGEGKEAEGLGREETRETNVQEIQVSNMPAMFQGEL